MNDLVQRLTQEQRVVASVRPETTVEGFKAAVDRKYVHIKFTETRGGTELGFPLEEEHSDLSGGDFEKGEGEVKLAGRLNLDGVPVRVHATLDLSTVEGTGHLEILEEDAEEEQEAAS